MYRDIDIYKWDSDETVVVVSILKNRMMHDIIRRHQWIDDPKYDREHYVHTFVF
jgi:hypothetical protein